MTSQVSIDEHLDRVRRVRSVACPRCGAEKGRPCRVPSGSTTNSHHVARYAALHKRGARRR